MVSKSREVGIRLSIKDADVAKRALQAFGKEGQQALASIEKAGRPASVSLLALNAAAGTVRGSFTSFAAGITAGLAPLLTITGLIAGAQAALAKFGNIADQAKSSGLDSEFFQGVAYQAKLAGVDINGAAVALDTFNRNVGQAAQGRGALITGLKTENAELLKNIQLASSQEERVRLVADAINLQQDASKKAAIATAAFGRSGADMVAVFEGGAAALDATIAKARELGIIVDRETIAKADELGDSFDTATEIIDNRFKQALINIAPGLVNFANWVAIITGNVKDLVDSFKSIDDLSTSGLDKRLKDLALKDLELERHELEVKARLDNPSLLDSLNRGALEAELTKTAGQRADNQSQQQAVLAEWNTRKPVEPTGTTPPMLPLSDEGKQAVKEAEALIKRLRTETEVYSDTIVDLKQKLDGGLITQETFNRGQAEAALKFAKAADDADEYAAALARIEDAHRQGLITELQYTDAVESLTKKRLTAQNDWAAGIQLGLMQIKDGAKDVATDVASAVTGWADELGQQIGQAAQTGKFVWQDLVKSILADTAKLATQQLITRPLSGLLGTVLSVVLGGGGGAASVGTGLIPGIGSFLPKYADGTDFHPGGWAEVGERGREVVRLPRGSQVIPNHKLGGTSVTLAPTYQIDGSGLSEAQLLRVMEANNAALLAQVPGAVKKAVADGVFG